MVDEKGMKLSTCDRSFTIEGVLEATDAIQNHVMVERGEQHHTFNASIKSVILQTITEKERADFSNWNTQSFEKSRILFSLA